MSGLLDRGGEARTPDQWFWRPLLYQLSYTPIVLPSRLLRLFVHDVFANNRIVLPQFQTSRGCAAILERVIHVTALRAAELHQNTITFFSHVTTVTLQLFKNSDLEPPMGFEPMTTSLPRKCSTPELGRLMWAGQDSNLRRLPPRDLQSPPFAARDTNPNMLQPAHTNKPQLGIEPRTDRLQGGCSAAELLWQTAIFAIGLLVWMAH